jgi:amidase
MINDELSIRTLARRIRSGASYSKDVFRTHLDSLERWNGATNAACFINRDGGIQAAEELDARFARGEKLGVLAGVPFTAKDHIRLAGAPRSMGTTFRAVARCERSDPLIVAAFHQDALCIAKGNQTEYGKAYFTENERFGKTVHFLDATRSPGGSGGGDAVIVAVGAALFGLGVDASGSVRVPSSFCGLYGLVPTHGLLPQSGLVEDAHCFSSTFSVPGIMTRTLEDLEITFSALRTFDAAYPYATAYPMGLQPDPVGMEVTRIGIVSSLRDIPLDSEIITALADVSRRCSEHGFSPRDFSSPLFAQTLEPFIVLNVQAVIDAEDLLFHELGTPRTGTDDGPRLAALRKKVAERLPSLTAAGLLLMLNRVEQLRRMAHTLFSEVDLLIAPVASVTAPPHGSDRFVVEDGSHERREIESQEAFLWSAMTNVLGLPSLAFPTHQGANGMPVGLQVIGPRFSELRMMRLLHRLGFGGRLSLDME